MARIRKVRKIGNSLYLPITATDAEDLKIKEGQEYDIEDIVPFKEKKK